MAKRKSKGAVSAVGSAGSSAKPPRGKPFEKGNPHRFKPGQSGNPAGQSKKAVLSEAYLNVLTEQMPKKLSDYIAQRIDEGVSVAEIISWAMAREIMGGNVAAATEMRKATEGDKQTAVTVDLTRCTDEQLQRIRAGEDPATVLGATAGGSGDGTPPPGASDSGR